MPVRIPGMNWKKEQRLKSGSVTVRQNSRLPMEITNGNTDHNGSGDNNSGSTDGNTTGQEGNSGH